MTQNIYDILPIQQNEALPVVLHGSGHPKDYPQALKLRDGLDSQKLTDDFINAKKELSTRFVRDRESMFPSGCDYNDVIASLRDFGFTSETYKPYSMRKLGTAELLDCIGAYTRQVLESIPAKLFRQQYLVAQSNWTTKVHTDHTHFENHGFRIHIPLNVEAVIAFPRDDGEDVYTLKPGELWFINPGLPHRGYNPTGVERYLLQAQMDTDGPLTGLF